MGEIRPKFRFTVAVNDTPIAGAQIQEVDILTFNITLRLSIENAMEHTRPVIRPRCTGSQVRLFHGG